MKSLKATLIDRFYGTASTAPATVFPRLIKGAQAHLGKLRKERLGAYTALQVEAGAIMGELTAFPAVLGSRTKAGSAWAIITSEPGIGLKPRPGKKSRYPAKKRFSKKPY